MADSRFTSAAASSIRLAQENAALLGHSYVGSEHLLLGLASQEYSPAGRALRAVGADSRKIRSEIARRIGTGSPTCGLHQNLTPNCCRLIRNAV